MEATNILDVERFVVACNDVLTGKFLDLNKRLDKFLAVMTQSEDILNLLSDCLQNFDEELEFSKAFLIDKKTGAVKIFLPSEDDKKLALCATIFNDLINEKLNTNRFLETYFKDSKLTPTQNFLDKIVKPYRDTICKCFEVDPALTADDVLKHESELPEHVEEQEEEVEEEFPEQDKLFAAIVKDCNQILSILKFERKRTDVLDDVEFVTNSIVKACEKKDLMVVNGLVIGLNYVSKKFRNVRAVVQNLNDMIFDYYEFLAGTAPENEENDENV